MKAFNQIAIPHEDIREGRLTMDIFAADLWQVVKGTAPRDYQDPDVFFRKTHITKGLKNILEVAESRLKGRGGDAVIQLHTPFGGGKTHTLIALYHKAKEWGANVVVFEGTNFDAKETRIWEELERQLTGKVEITKGNTSPGKEKLIKILSENAPVLILIDELLEYVTKAAGVRVGDSNLASQTYAFIQELTEAVSALGNTMLVLTLPSSNLEQYDEYAEIALNRLQRIVGRTERIYTPVSDDDIVHVVIKRLFSKIDREEAKKIVDDFVDYIENEGILSKEEATHYREKFLESYPFKPEVIEILYKRWGSFPSFQRTRGVLRLLSLVIYDMLDKGVPFIRLGDFDLSNEEIRRELIKHIGNQWDSIIYSDITSEESGAKKVDRNLGSAYIPYKLGTVVATTIFMTSFSGRGERGITMKELKLYASLPIFPTSVIDTVLASLREKLFYLSDEDLYFLTQPNLNKIILNFEDNISMEELYEEEFKLLENYISDKPKFKVFIHPKFPREIPDDTNLKLLIMKSGNVEREFVEKCGENPRIYKNTLIFLCPEEDYRRNFQRAIRRYLALKGIREKKMDELTQLQREEVKKKFKDIKNLLYSELRYFYRKILLPTRDGFKVVDLGHPHPASKRKLDNVVYEELKSEGEILEKISPVIIKDNYLKDRDYLEIKKLYDSFLKIPGNPRIASKEGFIESIKKGVKEGIFGYGKLIDGEIEVITIGETPDVQLSDDEIIIKPELCIKEEKIEEKKGEKLPEKHSTKDVEKSIQKVEHSPTVKVEEKVEEDKYRNITLKLKIPPEPEKILIIPRIVKYLTGKFKNCEIEVTIKAKDGEISKAEYENAIVEALKQYNIPIDKK
ncbi:AAA family ATPase [Methanofervidicoccus sp. A16]|uniref:ATP-binding protein n=1 Tax=Methanofervidicoccus sp. A16 TaxID=2607662 RepID=UPI0011882C85|nr:DUF499 domain-containing protein [Methanofervidicoccus sp. A16]AXI24739.1 AAA family ATPase [Methanofervidicoccus sp. A16]